MLKCCTDFVRTIGEKIVLSYFLIFRNVYKYVYCIGNKDKIFLLKETYI